MDWQTRLITLHLFVCDHFAQGLWIHAQRFAPHADLGFTDEEVVTVCLAGLLDKRREIRTIHGHAFDYWAEWFPRLPGYGAYVRRLNRLAEVFPPLLARLCPDGPPPTDIGLIDSRPVILAQQGRRFNARVARQELANSGYCPTKNLCHHGVKVHAIGDHRPGTLPLPRYIGVTPAGMSDGPALEAVAPALAYRELCSGKAYEHLARNPGLGFAVLTPVKKAKGQERLDSADRLYSAAVSRVRQPVESLFNWIQDKTGIECASKVRSFRGLLVHVFARLAAAMFLLNGGFQSA
ncbi:IS982 family transposase [Methylomagnum sp.]